MTWPTKKLGEVCDFQSGLWKGKKPPFKKVAVLRNTNFRSGGYLDLSNVAEIEVEKRQLADRLLQKGDLILERSGGGPTQPVGRVVYFNASEEFSFSNFTTRIRVKNPKEIDSEYLWRYLNYLYISGVTETLQKQTTGIRNLDFTEYKELEIPLPPIGEQRKIVGKIEKLFAKIDEVSRLRAESSAASAALLPSALHQVFSMQDSHSAIRANRRMVKTRWEEKTISEFTEINPSKKEIAGIKADAAVSFVPMAAVNETTQNIEIRQERKLGEVKKGYTYFRDNDVLFAKITPCMENGKIVIAKNLRAGIGFGSTEFHVVRAKEKILPAWLFYFLWNPEFREEAKKHMTGTAGQQRVPVDFLMNSKIPLPPIAEQKKIVAYLDALSQKSRELQNLQSQTAADFSALRQSILHNAFHQ